jgi:hypothetical protein
VTRATLSDRVLVTSGEHAGRVGIVVAHDPKWVRVRLTDSSWPFPTYAWVHRAGYTPLDPLAGLPEALV